MARLMGVIMVVLMLIALFVGGAQPQAVGLISPPWDKLAHVVFFFVFALLLARFISLPIAVVIVLTVLIGAADEVHQNFLPGRVPGFDDLLADLAGMGLGLIRYKGQGAD